MASHKCMVESTFYCEMETIWANMCDGTNIERVHGQLRAMPKATVEALVARQQETTLNSWTLKGIFEVAVKAEASERRPTT